MNTTGPITGTQSFTRRAVLIVVTNGLAFALSFAMPLLLVRALSQSEFGVYKQAFQILATALGMLNLQFATSIYYFLPRVGKRQWQVILNILLFYIAAGALVALDFTVFPGWVRGLINSPDLVSHMPSLGLAIWLWLVATNLEIVPLALGEVGISSLFVLGSQLTKSLLMVSVALVFPRLEVIIWAAIIQGLLQLTFFAFYLRRTFGPLNLRPDWALFGEQLRYALPYGAGTLAATFQGDLHNYFVSYFFSPAVFAVYAIGCFQVPMLALITNSFGSVLSLEIAEFAAKGDHRAIFSLWHHAVHKLALMFAPCLGLMFILRREIITLLFTETYAEAVPVFGVYLFGIIVLVSISGPLMRAFAEFRFFRLKLSLVLLPLMCSAMYVGSKVAGLVGVAAAVVTVLVVEMLITVRAALRRIGVTAGEMRQFASVGGAALAAFGAAFASWPIREALSAPTTKVVTIAATSVVFGVVYVVAVFVLGAVTNEEKDELRTAGRRVLRIFGGRRRAVLRWSERG